MNYFVVQYDRSYLSQYQYQYQYYYDSTSDQWLLIDSSQLYKLSLYLYYLICINNTYLPIYYFLLLHIFIFMIMITALYFFGMKLTKNRIQYLVYIYQYLVVRGTIISMAHWCCDQFQYCPLYVVQYYLLQHTSTRDQSIYLSLLFPKSITAKMFFFYLFVRL